MAIDSESSGEEHSWSRADRGAGAYRGLMTTDSAAPEWHMVTRRVTTDINTGELLDVINVTDPLWFDATHMMRPLPGFGKRRRDIKTVFTYESEGDSSPSSDSDGSDEVDDALQQRLTEVGTHILPEDDEVDVVAVPQMDSWPEDLRNKFFSSLISAPIVEMMHSVTRNTVAVLTLIPVSTLLELGSMLGVIDKSSISSVDGIEAGCGMEYFSLQYWASHAWAQGVKAKDCTLLFLYSCIMRDGSNAGRGSIGSNANQARLWHLTLT